ncbi:unnamed protein product [Ectocarpus fasciculatus]
MFLLACLVGAACVLLITRGRRNFCWRNTKKSLFRSGGLAAVAARDALRFCSDILILVKLLLVLKVKAARVRGVDWGVADMFQEVIYHHGDKPAIVVAETGSSTTYNQLDRRSNQVAYWALSQGLKKGDVVALIMPSCPDYVAIWLGMAKVGVCTALVNIHTKGPALAHAVRIAVEQSKSYTSIVVVDKSLAALMGPDVLDALPETVRICVYGGEAEAGDISRDDMRSQIATMSQGSVPEGSRRGIMWDSPLLHIYTSGTTGLPKASKISHLRFFSSAVMFSVTARLRSGDRVYCALPLYHSSGGMLGVGGCWRAGCTLVVRRRFSVSNFSSDCVAHRCSVVQYIGEVARYLVNSNETDLDQECSIRVAFGNGLSPDVWPHFQQRYHIERICEFYASTEGNVAMVNTTSKVGAVGVVPWFAAKLYPTLLLRMDPEGEELLRDSRGRCVPCQPGEVGQLMGLINDHDPARRFEGYTDSKASAKKMVRDVMLPGDLYFASGDLLRKDAFGFYYWVDRLGDTFRWKGENVATTEVAHAICGFPGVADVNVYGVEVPGTEGRAGMAAIALKESSQADELDWKSFFQHLDRHLPTFAQPQFLRVAAISSSTSHMTTTFKRIKTQLMKEGFDPAKVKVDGETLLLRDGVDRTFVPLSRHLYEAISEGSLRL